MSLPSLKQLQYLVALDEHRHFGKAARACFVSQSAFSLAIKELETVLKVQLVDRTSKSVTMTTAGMQAAAKARTCLRDVENLLEIPYSGEDVLGGKLTLGVIPTIAPFLLPTLMSGIGERFPALKLYLHERITPMLYDELMAGYLDVLLIAMPYDLKYVETMPLFKDRFRLACKADTQWLDPTRYSVERLKTESVLLLEDGHCLREHALSACKLFNHDKISPFAATSLYTLLHMVSSDIGITFIPEMAENSPMLQGGGIQVYELPEDSYRTIGLVWRKSSGRREEFRLFGEFIRQAVGMDD
jgi:LysR family hydrogen peroxide-inducible transcriptional activator